MSEFVTNDDMFGKYCKIPTGCSRTEHIYKIVKRIESNTYCDVPLYSGQTEEITHKDSVPVLLVIHCGVYESEVVRVPLAACKICGRPDGWISVKDRLPDCNGQYLVAYHPFCWDDVRCNEVRVDIDSYRELETPRRKGWAHNKHRLVTHWQPLPDPPKKEKKNDKLRTN